MTITEDYLDMAATTVAQIALDAPHGMEILDRYGLDYCCNGKLLFATACESATLDAESIWKEIQIAKTNYGPDSRIRFDTWNVPLVIDFIVQHHHRYVREAIPRLEELLDKVCSVHGEDSTLLMTVREDFNDLSDELLNHMPKEEEVIFPAMRRMFDGTYPNYDSRMINGSLGAPISVLEHEHERAADLIKSLRSQTNDYTPPAYACPTLRLTYLMLSQFDKDLVQHIHLENNILFPKVMGRKPSLLQ